MPTILRSFSLSATKHIPLSIVQTPGVSRLVGSAVSDPNFLNAIVMKRFEKWKAVTDLVFDLQDPNWS